MMDIKLTEYLYANYVFKRESKRKKKMTNPLNTEPKDVDLIAKMRNSIIREALARKIITEDDIKKYVGKYIDGFGFDGFVNYLSYLISVKDPTRGTFLTINQKMLIDRKELEERFKLKIREPGDVWDDMFDELAGRF
jgi:hypothetical protein